MLTLTYRERLTNFWYRLIDMFSMPLTEYGARRKEILKHADAIAHDLYIRVVNLIGLDADDDLREKWKKECIRFLWDTAHGRAEGRHLKFKDYHFILFVEPFDPDPVGLRLVNLILERFRIEGNKNMSRNDLTDEMVFNRVKSFYKDLCEVLNKGGDYKEVIGRL